MMIHNPRGLRLAALVTLLLTTTSLVATGPAAASRVPADNRPLGTIAVVPLDDRPVNTYAPAMTAASAGFEVRLPPRELIGRFFQPGDGDRIGDWLAGQHADSYVVSVSMLAYGGLIASRTAEPTLDQARRRVAALRELRAARPDAELLVYDTIQRLALTSGDPDFTEYAELLRTWAILYDRVENLGHEQLRGDLDATRARIPDDALADYLAARARNHEVNRLMVQWVADGTISHLVLSEDDTSTYGLSRAERVRLEALVDELGVADRVEIFPGADEVDATLIARAIQHRLGTAATYAIEYAGVSGETWTAQLEGIPFAENIRRHVTAAGGRVIGTGDPDIHLLVNTPSADPATRAADLDRFVARADALIDAGERVIVIDPLIVNRADHALVARMEQRLDLLRLLSYSGWNTGGNALGLALGHGTSRWAFLQRSGSGDGVPDLAGPGEAQVSYLLHRFVKDDPWKNIVQVAAYAHGRELGWNIFSFTPEQKAYFDTWVAGRLVPITRQYFTDHFAGHDVELGHRGTTRIAASVDSLGPVLVELPWDRLFETGLEPQVTLRPHPPQPAGQHS